MEMIDAMAKLKPMLDEQKFRHSVLTMQTAVEFAEACGVDPDCAALAGLLHDCATGLPTDEQARIMRCHGEEPDRVSLDCPILLHGPAGAIIAREQFLTADKDILNAIWYHTYGRSGMSPLEKLIFTADFIEPSRRIPAVVKLREPIREALRTDLDKAALMTLEATLRYLLETAAPIHPNSIDMRNDILRG